MNEQVRLCSRCHEQPATSNRLCTTCNAERMRTKRQDTSHDVLSLAHTFGISIDPGMALFLDTLNDAQVLFLLERIYGRELGQQKLRLLTEEGRLE